VKTTIITPKHPLTQEAVEADVMTVEAEKEERKIEIKIFFF